MNFKENEEKQIYSEQKSLQLSNTAPLFMTHHSPVGSFSSFTFGAIGKGVSIDLETPRICEERFDLYAGYSQDNRVYALPFQENIDTEVQSKSVYDEGNKEQVSNNTSKCTYFSECDIKRTLTPCVDQYEAGRITLTVYTHHPKLEDPEKSALSPYAVCPGMLFQLTLDNSTGNTPAEAFLGLGHSSIRYIHTVKADDMLGIGCRSNWALLADDSRDTFLVRTFKLDSFLKSQTEFVHETGPGVLCVKAMPGEKKELFAAFGFYSFNPATSNPETTYCYREYFSNVRQVCRFILDNASRIMSECRTLDHVMAARIKNSQQLQIISQGIRGYEASTQLACTGGQYYYNVGEGAYCWRNTLDLAVDHLPWELYRNPWVVRNIMDMYIDQYSYYDKVSFSANPEQFFEGGLSFTHDMGNYITYSPFGHSDYESDGYKDASCYFYMTTEELLNGTYCICAYGLFANDTEWLQKRSTILKELLYSLENRDDSNPEQRNGILKGTSSRGKQSGRESTTYDALDHSLMDAAGNLYIAVKTNCALIMLQRCFDVLGDIEFSQRAAKMLQLNQHSLRNFVTAEGYLRANLYTETDSRILAAIEPLAIPYMLGLTGKEIEPIKKLLLKHICCCMQEGYCIDETTGGVRLSSKSNNTWVSKVILCFAMLENVFDIDINEEYPAIMRELTHWCQISAKNDSISDQIHTTKRKVIGGCYYPRSASSAIWLYYNN